MLCYVKSVEINIFNVNNKRGALCLSHGRRMGYPASYWELRINNFLAQMVYIKKKTVHIMKYNKMQDYFNSCKTKYLPGWAIILL